MRKNEMINRIFDLLEYDKNIFIFERVLCDDKDKWCFRSNKSKYVFLFEIVRDIDDTVVMTPMVYKNQLNDCSNYYVGSPEYIAYLMNILIPGIKLKLKIKEKYKLNEPSDLFIEKIKENLCKIKLDNFCYGDTIEYDRYNMIISFIFEGDSEKMFKGQKIEYSFKFTNIHESLITVIVTRYELARGDGLINRIITVFNELVMLNDISIGRIYNAITSDLQTIN